MREIRFNRVWFAIAALASLCGCTANPITGRSQLILVSESSAIASSASAYATMVGRLSQQGRIETGTPRAERVQEITNRLISEAVRFRPESANWKWEVVVINQPKTVNAFCMAGGKMGIYTGFWDKVDASDDEIAAIMGHEIAHALANHTAERISVAVAAGVGAAVVAGIASRRSNDPYAFQRNRNAAELAAILAITLPNSREAESEADQIGIELAARAGFDPQGAVSLWNKMAQLRSISLEFLSTHPSPENRAQQMQAALGRVEPLYRLAKEKNPTSKTSALASIKPQPRGYESAAGAQNVGRSPDTSLGISAVHSLVPASRRESNVQDIRTDGKSQYADLMTAVMSSDREAVDYFIAQGADINERRNGITYLIAAVVNDDFEMAKFLVSRGAEVNKLDSRGLPAIMYAHAARPPNIALSKFLQEAGAINPFAAR